MFAVKLVILCVFFLTEVSQEDGKPKELCSSCKEQLDLSVTFKKQVERANLMLDDHLINPEPPTCESPALLITGDILPEFITVEKESTQVVQNPLDPGEPGYSEDVSTAWESVVIKVEEEFVTADPWPEANTDPTVEDVLNSHLPVKVEKLVDEKKEVKPTVEPIGQSVDVKIEQKPLLQLLTFANNQVKPESIAPHPRLVDDSEDDEKDGNNYNLTSNWSGKNLKTKILNFKSKGDNKGFYCKNCSKKYQNKSLLKKHVKHKRCPKTIKCRYCERIFPSIRSLNGHLRLHVERQTSEISSPQTNITPNHIETDFSDNSKSNKNEPSCEGQASERMEGETEIDPEAEDATNGVRRSSRTIKVPKRGYFESNVEKTENESKDLGQSCDGARRSARTIKAPERHVVPHYKCTKCERMYNDEVALTQHQKSHSGVVFKCNHCKRKFYDKDDLASHIERRHLERSSRSKSGPQPFKKKGHKCDVCGNTFDQRNHLFSHMRSHKSLVNLCEICGKTVNHSAYFQHKRSHLMAGSQEVFQCDMCSKQFNNKLSLRSHKKANHGDLKFTCEVCGKMFTTMALMKHHQNIHSGKREHVCQVCNKAFTLKVTLKAHMRIHTGEMPYTCETCGRSFTWKTTYRNHVAACKKTETPIESKVSSTSLLSNTSTYKLTETPVEHTFLPTSLAPNVVHYTSQIFPQESPIDYSEEAKYRPPAEEHVKFEEDVKYSSVPPNQMMGYSVPFNMRDEIKYTYQQPLNFAGDVKTFFKEYKPSQ